MAETVAETRAVAAARMSERNIYQPNYEEMDGGGEDDSESDSESESRATKDVARFRPTRVTMARCPRLCLRQSRLAG